MTRAIAGFSMFALLLGCASTPREVPPSAFAVPRTAEPDDNPSARPVLSLVFGGMWAPRVFYDDFNWFLATRLVELAGPSAKVATEFIGSGPHVLRMMIHASKVASGVEPPYSAGTSKKARDVVRRLVDPFFEAYPDGILVLGGHSFGSIVMQSVKSLVEETYGKPSIAASYALAPIAHALDPEVLVLVGPRDVTVPISNLLCRGRAVSGALVTVPGLDHFEIHNSPEARTALAAHLAGHLGATPHSAESLR